MSHDSVSRDLFDSEIASLRREIAAVDRIHTELSVERDRAIQVGFAASTEKGKMHNDLIQKGEVLQASMVTRVEAGWLVMFLLAVIVAAVTVATYFNK